VALEHLLVLIRGDQLRQLRGEEAAQPSQPLQLLHLLLDTLFKSPVPLGELGRLGLDGVVICLDA
jgi:hypothetical protein